MTAQKTPDQAIMAQELDALKGFCPLFRAKLVQIARMNIESGNLELIGPIQENVVEAFRTAKESIADHCIECAQVANHRAQGVVTPVVGEPGLFNATINVLTSQSVITESSSEF